MQNTVSHHSKALYVNSCKTDLHRIRICNLSHRIYHSYLSAQNRVLNKYKMAVNVTKWAQIKYKNNTHKSNIYNMM